MRAFDGSNPPRVIVTNLTLGVAGVDLGYGPERPANLRRCNHLHLFSTGGLTSPPTNAKPLYVREGTGTSFVRRSSTAYTQHHGAVLRRLSLAVGCGSYENEQSIAAKGDYARSQGLGGTIIWTIGQGHLPAAPVGSRDPLLAAAHQAVLAQ